MFPAIVALSERADPDVFWLQDAVVEPEPEPLVGDTESQEDPFADAVQFPPAQPEGKPVIVTSCDPAAAVGLVDDGASEKLVHVGGDVPA